MTRLNNPTKDFRSGKRGMIFEIKKWYQSHERSFSSKVLESKFKMKPTSTTNSVGKFLTSFIDLSIYFLIVSRN